MASCLIICPTDTWGGVEKNVLLRTQHMAERGHDICVVLLANTFEDRFAGLENVQIHTISNRSSDLLPRVYREYVRLMRSVEPDCVFIPLKRDWWAGTIAARIAGVRRVVLYMGIRRRLRANLKYRLMLKTMKAKLMVNSEDLRHHLMQHNPWVTDQNCRVIYNGFSLPDLEHPVRTLREELSIPGTAQVIGAAGRFSHQKGFDQLPALMSKLPESVHCLVAGDGATRPQVEQALKAANLTHRVHLTGNLKDMASFYRSLDLFVLMSRNEGMANVLNEAMSYGLPIVSTRVPGSTELLDEGRHGIITEIDDVDGLVNAVTKVMADKTVFLPSQQRDKIAKDHSLQQMMDSTEQMFFY